ncbi:hypothetical protein GOBAR_AA31976 [Gossypium barbadense]|uniref:Major facilitator superfamily (MFS) profile domain-containing protein n=1 Tax=Gossypium barbadense TaxID=3634 RepID=A0A2P5WC95_GOSBA|nr:hypothetical protein GOBAR_AA31976 [Gossypium barbadense]
MFVVGSFVHWRTLALLATIPALLQLLLLFFIPESPQWLAKFGSEKELEATLLCLRGDKADISHEATEIKTVAGVLVLMNLGGINALTGVLVLMNLGGINALTYYSGAIFVSAGVSSMVGLITLAATQTVIGILGATLIDKLLNWNNNHQCGRGFNLFKLEKPRLSTSSSGTLFNVAFHGHSS